MKENKTFFQWVENNFLYVVISLGLAAIVNGLFSACKPEPRPLLVAARVTLIQREATYSFSCGKYHTNTCTGTVRPAVHFLHDGSHYYHAVNTDFEIRGFRHWGCYWVRMQHLMSEHMVSSVVGPAPEQACAD